MGSLMAFVVGSVMACLIGGSIAAVAYLLGLSRQEVGGGEWERGIVSADAALNYGCRWTTGQKPDHRTSRPFCPACQRIVVVGPFGWSDGRRFGLPPAALPDPGQLALPGVA